MAKDQARYGCQYPDVYDLLLWILNEEDCLCNGEKKHFIYLIRTEKRTF